VEGTGQHAAQKRNPGPIRIVDYLNLGHKVSPGQNYTSS
jgi:hypothetical protein